MQFTLVVLLAIVATVSAGPLRVRLATCDLKTCAVDLAPTVTSCATAAADLTAVPFSDAGCVAAAVTQGVDLPAACTGCVDLLINGKVAAANSTSSTSSSNTTTSVIQRRL
ncbi:hypothetical protein DFH06DRAFT_769267 [Mycena polygramma]|nr:hypothetical protein DFH06DRAFT_769267 [Mycena polygramma]